MIFKDEQSEATIFGEQMKWKLRGLHFISIPKVRYYLNTDGMKNNREFKNKMRRRSLNQFWLRYISH